MKFQTYMKSLLMIGLAATINLAHAQIERKGTLVSWVKNLTSLDSVKVTIEYTDQRLSKFKIFRPSTRQTEVGYLNRLTFNLSPLDKKYTFKKDELSESINSDGYTRFCPNYSFTDTANLLKYDYRHLLHDSISYTLNDNGSTLDSCAYKIHETCDGKYYSVIRGRKNVYGQDRKLIKTIDVIELSRDVFYSKDVEYLNGTSHSEKIEIFGPAGLNLFTCRIGYGNSSIVSLFLDLPEEEVNIKQKAKKLVIEKKGKK